LFIPSQSAHELAQEGRNRPSGRGRVPELIERLNRSDFVEERYPELVADEGVVRSLDEFNVPTSYAAIRAGESYVIGYWGMYDDGGATLATRIAEDGSFRDALPLSAFGLSG
jgi:hypothetical protein